MRFELPPVLWLTKQTKCLKKPPPEFSGKFMVIPIPNENSSIVIRTDSAEFHQQIVETFSKYLNNINPKINFKPRRWDLLGGGYIQIKCETIAVSDHSQQYGRFDEKTVTECLKKAFPRKEIQIKEW